jgi:hypothetical protein
MAVFFQCKSCDGEHRSPAGFVDRQSFDASPMPELRFVCRVTGAMTSYRRSDMYWRADMKVGEDVVATRHVGPC